MVVTPGGTRGGVTRKRHAGSWGGGELVMFHFLILVLFMWLCSAGENLSCTHMIWTLLYVSCSQKRFLKQLSIPMKD